MQGVLSVPLAADVHRSSQTIIQGATLLAAIAAWLSARNTFRASYQPAVRPILIPTPPGPFPDSIILRIEGRGAALTVTVAILPSDSEGSLIAEVDVIEPLGQPRGPKFDEASRIGRVSIRTQNAKLAIGKSYRVVYQDSAGDWHETHFSVSSDGFRTKFKGRSNLTDVPKWIRDRPEPLCIRFARSLRRTSRSQSSCLWSPSVNANTSPFTFTSKMSTRASPMWNAWTSPSSDSCICRRGRP